jgi:hypothetical protein
MANVSFVPRKALEDRELDDKYQFGEPKPVMKIALGVMLGMWFFALSSAIIGGVIFIVVQMVTGK